MDRGEDNGASVEYFHANAVRRRIKTSKADLIIGVLMLILGGIGVAFVSVLVFYMPSTDSLVPLIMLLLFAAPGGVALYIGIAMITRRKPIT